MKIENILSVGKGNGEMDFEIAATITDLSLEQMNEFRAMLSVAIGTAEQMWRQALHEVAESKDGKTYNWERNILD